MTLTEAQEKVKELMENAKEKSELKPWLVGYIPENYKRISIDMEEAIELARVGFREGMALFSNSLYFTQSVIMGAALSEKYDHIMIITTSQYGKSWLMGQIALALANKNEPVYVTGANIGVTNIIMEKVISHLQTADGEIKDKIIDLNETGKNKKIEKLQQATNKQKVSLSGGGKVHAMSLGDTYSNSLKGNMMIGNSGHIITDESSQVSDNAQAELGRREFSQKDGKVYKHIEISNPHNPGRFYNRMIEDEVPENRLIIWMDARTVYEEGGIISKEKVYQSEFYANKSTCIRYLLCELEDYAEESMFPEPKVSDEPIHAGAKFYMGIDSAYKGKDDIRMTIGAMDNGNPRVLKSVNLKDELRIDEWIDGETGEKIAARITRYIVDYRIGIVCIDTGWGVWLLEMLMRFNPGVKIVGIAFSAKPTPERVKKRHYSSLYAYNKRAEMHLDVQNLMDENRLLFTSEIRDEVQEEIQAVRRIVKPNGKIVIQSKKEIKQSIGHSPDILDSILLMIHAIVLSSISFDVFMYEYNEEREENYV